MTRLLVINQPASTATERGSDASVRENAATRGLVVAAIALELGRRVNDVAEVIG
jgi:hypothetical protein